MIFGHFVYCSLRGVEEKSPHRLIVFHSIPLNTLARLTASLCSATDCVCLCTHMHDIGVSSRKSPSLIPPNKQTIKRRAHKADCRRSLNLASTSLESIGLGNMLESFDFSFLINLSSLQSVAGCVGVLIALR